MVSGATRRLAGLVAMVTAGLVIVPELAFPAGFWTSEQGALLVSATALFMAVWLSDAAAPPPTIKRRHQGKGG
ncbi:MAG: hypothetical protein AAGH15_13670 [Myxococcota bacterium]